MQPLTALANIIDGDRSPLEKNSNLIYNPSIIYIFFYKWQDVLQLSAITNSLGAVK